MKNEKLLNNHRFKTLLEKVFIYFLIIFQTGNVLSQNVGINQPNPIWPLDISSPQCVARLITTSSSYGSVLELKNTNASAEYLGAINFNDPTTSYPGQISYKLNNSMSFRVGQQERMIINDNGRVGIGTQTPNSTLDIYAGNASVRVVSTNTTAPSILELQNILPGATYLGAINFTNQENGWGQIIYYADHNLSFITNGTERIRTNGTGVGIFRIPLTNKLEVEGNASKSSAGDWLANSDSRLKKNIKPLDSEATLNKLLMLQGVTYEWNDDKTGSQRPEGIQFGFIAQNIQEVFPTLVEEDNLGYLQTAYGTYDPMVVEAIRALNTEIKLLKAELERINQQLLNSNSKNNEIAKQ